jgi:beta-galactosidase GanA
MQYWIFYFTKMRHFRSSLLAFVILIVYHSPSNAQQKTTIPNLARTDGVAQLYVDGKPFLILGGELGNSSASDMNYLRPCWQRLKAMHLNTVLAPVYWELMEPDEGRFDFSLVDSLIHEARQWNLKLVLLWFGSWKNSMSCYAPEWIKLNQQKYERARDSKGKALEILSAFNTTNLERDSKAFSALLKHVGQVDSRDHTVIMIQVENEIGMLTEAREYTKTANLAFRSQVPSALMNYLVKNKNELGPEILSSWHKSDFANHGTWEEVFGKGLSTDEIFQAWQYAVYTNTVAASGKKEYPIPMYVNAALNYKNANPGQYPSAGPLPHVMDIWQAGAPEIDILSPDFYNPNFRQYSDLYSRRNNPFFIPEIRSEPNNAAKVFLAVGHYKAIGFSPFSIESVTGPLEEPIAKSYGILEQLSPLITEYQAKKKIEGVLLDSGFQKQVFLMGNYRLTASHEYSLGWSTGSKNPGWPESGGLIMQTDSNEFIIAGTGIVITFASVDEHQITGILQAEEGEFVNGKWIRGRRMNGDQDHQGRHIRIPVKEFSIQRVKLYEYH